MDQEQLESKYLGKFDEFCLKQVDKCNKIKKDKTS